MTDASPSPTAPPTVPPGDGEIRAALLRRLMAAHKREADTAFIEELGLCRGRVRVDIAVVNGLLHGYEIKSDRDSLRRLSGQVDLYGKVLDRATLVVGVRHAEDAITLLPPWWEVQVVDGDVTAPRLKQARRGRKNPARCARALVELLWLDDALALLEARGGARGYRGSPRRVVWDRVCELYDLDELGQAVRAQLKARSVQQCTPMPE